MFCTGGFKGSLISQSSASLEAVSSCFSVCPDLGHVPWHVFRRVFEATARAIELQAEAGLKNREIVRELRAKHLSVSDVAAVLEISHGRVAQLKHAQG